MKAAVITQPGAPEVLQWKEYATPQPGKEEILIEVKAAGVNRADVAQRQGKYPAPAGVPADVPGLEAAGVVISCGEGVTMWQPGDKVCALLAGGGYAEQVVVKEGQCLPVPEGYSFAEAASLPEAIFTVWSNIFQRGSLQPGETLLVHGGSSGIGVTAIQLAHALGSKVMVTVGSDEKGAACIALGADRFINYKQSDFEQELSAEKVDVILDMVGGDYLPKNLRILREEGRLVYINTMGGNRVEMDLSLVMRKRLTITGSTLRAREYAFKKALTADILERVWPLLQDGKFKPVIYKTFPFAAAAAAHQLMESSEHIGKIMLVSESAQ
ncbi:NAD(P)H-quinone oxidoreductase [Chitinophaga rhizophila]|uniref:NAD(P)H-quinone oxidoreductase n=1 Tax=Chitinophaga rhizophila TaxID=2866212 RepID=A0ABS7GIJ3_9BACT|nr:NAD(P)H-quinone oxidoreductase [Chitinophaga rhizophila]MBW8687504.1 NAD(P)H-quinone oxidoreductase [Chitinophaga rhizophila]